MAAAIASLLMILAVTATVAAIRQASLARRTESMYQNARSQNYAITVAAAYHAWEQGDLERAEALLTTQTSILQQQRDSPFEFWHLWNRINGLPSMALVRASISARAH